MNWSSLIVPGLFIIACLLAIYQSRKEQWTMTQNVGTTIFLLGAAIGLFLDNLVSGDSPLFTWIEPIGAAVVVVGLFVSWFWQSDERVS